MRMTSTFGLRPARATKPSSFDRANSSRAGITKRGSRFAAGAAIAPVIGSTLGSRETRGFRDEPGRMWSVIDTPVVPAVGLGSVGSHQPCRHQRQGPCDASADRFAVARDDRPQHHHTMPFFEPISPPPPEEHEQAERVWAPPRWDRPSEGTLPVTFAVSQLFGRTVNAAFALDHLRVYPNGFQLVVTVIANPRLPPELHMGGFASFSLMATAKTKSADEDNPNPPPPPPRIRLRGGMLDMAPRLGIRFSNGQSAGFGSAVDIRSSQGRRGCADTTGDRRWRWRRRRRSLPL